jgi:hypothetical protein
MPKGPGGFQIAEIMSAATLQWTLVISSCIIMSEQADLRATNRNSVLLASLEAFFISKLLEEFGLLHD